MKFSEIIDAITLSVTLKRVRSAKSRRAETPHQLSLDAKSFYALPTTPVNVEKRQCWVPGLYSYNLVYRSPVVTGYPWNDTVYCRYYGKNVDGRPIVVLMHGWMASTYLLYAPIYRRLVSLGIDVVMIQLPYHMGRTIPGSFSGQHALCGSLSMTIEAVRQGVLDTRVLLSWLRERYSGPIGVFGVSFGGLIGAMVTAHEAALDFSVLMTPAADPAALFWRSAIGRAMLLKEAAGAARREIVRDYFKVITPKYFAPAIPRERIVIVQSLSDRIVPPFVVRELWESWKKPQLIITNDGHVMTMLRKSILEEVVAKVPCLHCPPVLL